MLSHSLKHIKAFGSNPDRESGPWSFEKFAYFKRKF